MKKIVTLLCLALFVTPAAAWELEKSVDAMTDEVSRTSFIKSTAGDKFTLIRKRDNSVWGYLKLNGANQFMVNERLLLRVDKNTPTEQNDDFNKKLAAMGLSNSIPSPKMWEWNPDLIGFRVWHGKLDEGCGFVQELYDGKKMVIRYHPNQSTTKDIHFDISTNKKAIPASLGIDMNKCGE